MAAASRGDPGRVSRRPSFADGNRQPHLGHIGNRHLEEFVQDGEGPPVPMGVRYRVVAPTIQGERSIPRWSTFADLDGQRAGRIGGRVPRAWVLRYVVLSYLHIVLRHEVEQVIEAAELQGPEQWPVAPGVVPTYVDQ